mmetsp:Transcript_16107/g.38255  ORF Transcript_16107/g.38255 Transcript_16107/m.38255 type:complete len:200 (-) Transcript_16107:499-1098(-)
MQWCILASSCRHGTSPHPTGSCRWSLWESNLSCSHHLLQPHGRPSCASEPLASRFLPPSLLPPLRNRHWLSGRRPKCRPRTWHPAAPSLPRLPRSPPSLLPSLPSLTPRTSPWLPPMVCQYTACRPVRPRGHRPWSCSGTRYLRPTCRRPCPTNSPCSSKCSVDSLYWTCSAGTCQRRWRQSDCRLAGCSRDEARRLHP